MPLEKQRNRNAEGGEGADDFRETEMQEQDCASDAFRETGVVLQYSYINFKILFILKDNNNKQFFRKKRENYLKQLKQ